MDSFSWKDSFATGFKDVDKQHKDLVDLLNKLGEILTHSSIDIEGAKAVIVDLFEYSNYHFKSEEELMFSNGIDNRHYRQHKQKHTEFLEEIVRLSKGDIDNRSLKYIFEFLTHWLVYHILGEDQNMSRQLQAIGNGFSAEEAYSSEELEHDSATQLLLTSLNRLFEQVSLRNIELEQLNESLEEKVSERTAELEKLNRELRELSLTDSLTGLPNRRYITSRLQTLWERDIDIVCMIIDADHFKEVNDTYGHDIGDRVLIELSNRLSDAVRTDDIVGRLGGDEFIIVCPETDLGGGLHLANSILESVNRLVVGDHKAYWRGSISVGVAERKEAHRGFKDLLKESDLGVYSSKEAGRNCVRTVQERS
jgi:hemerythrin